MTRGVTVVMVLLCACGAAGGQKLHLDRTINAGAEVSAVAISPDGKQLAASCRDRKLRIWKLPGGEQLHALDSDGDDFGALAFSRNGRRLAAARQSGKLTVFNSEDYTVVRELAGKPGIESLALSADGRLLATAPLDEPAQLWDVDQRRLRAELKTEFSGSSALAFSPDGNLLASSDADTVIRIYETASGRLRASVADFLLESFALAFTPDGKHLVIGGGDKVIVAVDPSTGKPSRQSDKQPDPIGWLGVLGDGKTVVAGFFNADNTRLQHTSFWNMETGALQNLSEERINGGVALNDGRVLLTSSDGTALKVWIVAE